MPEAVSRGVQGVPAPPVKIRKVGGTPQFDHQGSARHPPELFPPISTITNISASDLVLGDHALGIKGLKFV